MVSRWFPLFALLIACAPPTTASAEGKAFGVEVESREVEYGKPLDVELYSRSGTPSLSRTDLSPLREDFVVQTPDNAYAPADAPGQRWRVRLYPRRTGELAIPSLFFRGMRSAPIDITATAPVETGEQTPIRVHSRLDDRPVWVNQAVRIIMTIETTGRGGWLETDTARASGVEIRALPAGRETVTEGDEARTRHRLGWILYPRAGGHIDVQLPPVRYRRDGVTTHSFYPPRVELEVRELPPYVPPTMPVGRVEFEAALPDRLFFIERELAFLSLRVTDERPPGRSHNDLLRQLRSSEALTFYPAQIEAANLDAGEGRNTNHYQVPFAPEAMGAIALPSLRLQYFDPDTGTIEAQAYPLGTVLSISRWLVWAVAAALAAAALLLARLLVRWLRREWRRHRVYWNALQGLERAEDPAALKAMLMEVAVAEGWPANLTLAQWAGRWQQHHGRCPSPGDALERLQARRYGGADVPLTAIRPALVETLSRRLPLLRPLRRLCGRR